MLLFTPYETIISIYLYMICTRKNSSSMGNIPPELYATRYQFLEEHKKVTERKKYVFIWIMSYKSCFRK